MTLHGGRWCGQLKRQHKETPRWRMKATVHRQRPPVGMVVGKAMPTGRAGILTVMTTATCMAGMAGKTGILMAGNVGASGTVQMAGEVGIGMATITTVVGIAVIGNYARDRGNGAAQQ